MCGKRFEVSEVYPKGAQGRLVKDQKFIDDFHKHLVKDIVMLVRRTPILMQTVGYQTRS